MSSEQRKLLAGMHKTNSMKLEFLDMAKKLVNHKDLSNNPSLQ